MFRFLLAFICLVAAAVAPGARADPTNFVAGTPGEVVAGQVLRDTPMYGFAGDFRRLSEFRGKPLLINVWASWCGPCRQEMPSLERLSRRVGGRQFNIIGVSTDDDAAAAMRFLRQYGITFDNYLDRKLALEDMLGAAVLPLTVLVDAKGRVVLKTNGAREWDSPESLALIARLLRVGL
jgi:thiol-disulfide isomerase/thioredoxin